MEAKTCDRCGAEVPEDQIFLGTEKKTDDLYEELCSECFDGGNEWLERSIHVGNTKNPL